MGFDGEWDWKVTRGYNVESGDVERPYSGFVDKRRPGAGSSSP